MTVDHRDRNVQTVVRVGRELGFTDDEIVCAVAGMLAECDGHNYGNEGAADRIWHPTPDELASLVEKDPMRIAALLATSLQWADTDEDGDPYVGRDWCSLGIYQQIPSGIYRWGWGSVEQLMTPDTAARKFFAALKATPGVVGDPIWYRVQMVQRSQYDGVTINPATGQPYTFAQNYADRMEQAQLVFADPEFFTKEVTP